MTVRQRRIIPAGLLTDAWRQACQGQERREEYRRMLRDCSRQPGSGLLASQYRI